MTAIDGSRQLPLPSEARPSNAATALPVLETNARRAACLDTQGGIQGEPYLTITKLAERLGVSYRVALDAANSGQLPTYQFGNSRRRGLESEWRAMICQLRGGSK